jgi:hypothetical protein
MHNMPAVRQATAAAHGDGLNVKGKADSKNGMKSSIAV